MLHGTGDLLSALLAAVMCGQEIADAVNLLVICLAVSRVLVSSQL